MRPNNPFRQTCSMTPVVPGALSCPDCGHLHVDARHRSFNPSGNLLYSDLHREVISMAAARPQYVTCRACGHVNLLADFRAARHPGTCGVARWVEATRDEAFTTLVKAQPPFIPGSGYAHTLRLHLWREENHLIALGVPVADPQRRAQLMQALLEECCARSKMPIYQYLLGEIERQQGDFEVAAQRFRNLAATEQDDPLLAWYSRQNLVWCAQGRTLQQRLSEPPRVTQVFSAPEKRPREYKFVMAASDSGIQETIGRWVKFPSGILNIGDVKFLPLVATMSNPMGGVVVQESDLAKAWPGDSGIAPFIESVSKTTRTLPWLLLGAQDETRAWVVALRLAGFHASSMDPQQLDQLRFEEWALHGQRRAEHQWRRVQKCQ